MTKPQPQGRKGESSIIEGRIARKKDTSLLIDLQGRDGKGTEWFSFSKSFDTDKKSLLNEGDIVRLSVNYYTPPGTQNKVICYIQDVVSVNRGSERTVMGGAEGEGREDGIEKVLTEITELKAEIKELKKIASTRIMTEREMAMGATQNAAELINTILKNADTSSLGRGVEAQMDGVENLVRKKLYPISLSILNATRDIERLVKEASVGRGR
ncbi:MAG: hypothetical protein DDT19_00014 [Syntrophomonadaceae bacterium]|nr:hypothetical protein [Bacillota bacterium]